MAQGYREVCQFWLQVGHASIAAQRSDVIESRLYIPPCLEIKQSKIDYSSQHEITLKTKHNLDLVCYFKFKLIGEIRLFSGLLFSPLQCITLGMTSSFIEYPRKLKGFMNIGWQCSSFTSFGVPLQVFDIFWAFLRG